MAKSVDLAKRPSHLAKGEWGKLLILAGSTQFSGAAVLTTLGALRTGLDLAVVAAPQRAANAVLAAAPDAVTIPLKGDQFERDHVGDIEYFSSYPVAIGSGLTTDGSARKFLREVLRRFSGPFVLDADALTILADDEDSPALYDGKAVVLTPNLEEYATLAGEKKPQPKRSIEALAKKWRATILCKGRTDIISDGDELAEVTGGSDWLAKAGTGDVLTGVVGALVARGARPFKAAVAAAQLVKEAGERAAPERGPGLLASDVAQYLDLRNLND